MLDKDLLRSRECKDLGWEESHEVLTQPQTSNVVQMYQPNLFDSWGKYQQCLKHGLITFVTIKKSCPLHIAHEFPDEKRQFTNQVSLNQYSYWHLYSLWCWPILRNTLYFASWNVLFFLLG